MIRIVAIEREYGCGGGEIAKYFHVEWPNRAIYHAMMNTAPGDDVVVQAILDLKKIVERSAHPAFAR